MKTRVALQDATPPALDERMASTWRNRVTCNAAGRTGATHTHLLVAGAGDRPERGKGPDRNA
jgi:hypothetical protein